MRAPRLLALLVATAASLGVLGSAPPAVLAATPDLTIVTDARYDVQPSRHLVHVTVDLALTNHKRDTTTKRYYFDHAFLAVPPGSSGYRLSWAGTGTPVARVAKRTATYILLRLDLAQRLQGGRSAAYRLTFDLKDPGGTPTRELRVGDTLVSFQVWAYASDETPGSTVTVVFPPGYEVQVEAGRIPKPTTAADGRTIFETGPLARPLDFFAYLVGDRPGAYRDSTVRTTVAGTPIEIRVRAWADDPAWAKRVGSLLTTAMPTLGAEIGLPWPAYSPPLTIEEAVSRSTGGYAGIFDPAAGKVAIAYYAGSFVILHEASHAWFNGQLLADRWANEAFASYYAAVSASRLKVKVTTDVLTDALRTSRIPLNAWGPLGSGSPAQEDYAYAASLALAREIGKRATPDVLRRVWADAAARIGAYQPVGGGNETVDGPPDWRGLLDLLEADPGATFDDLWRDWVARPEDLPLLGARAAARQRYAAFLGAAGDWRPPKAIRDAMRAWRFDAAEALMAQGQSVLDLRSRITSAADAAGLVAPAALRTAFEDGGFDTAVSEGDAELQAIDRYVAAVGRRPAAISPIMSLGLWSETPEADLVAAREAFARGDVAASVAASDEAAASWINAEAVGQGRAFSMAALALFLIVSLSALVAIGRSRRRRRRLRMATPMPRR
jgi:hypothetical protein